MMKKYVNRISVIVSLLIVFSSLYIYVDADKERQISFALWEKVEKSEDLNFLMLGTDKDETRTDLILLCHYDADENVINAMQIPRDTMVETTRHDKKINSAYGCKDGLKKVKDEVYNLTGIYTDKYIVLNFEGFRKLVDALGGVEYTVPVNMEYTDPAQNLYINLKKGRQILDGEKAEMFMRFRQNNDGSGYAEGDIGRLKAQKGFYKAVVKKILSFEGIMNIGGVMESVGGNLKTDFQIKDLFSHIGDFRRMNESSVNVFLLPGNSEYINNGKSNISYYIVDKNKLEELKNKYFN